MEKSREGKEGRKEVARDGEGSGVTQHPTLSRRRYDRPKVVKFGHSAKSIKHTCKNRAILFSLSENEMRERKDARLPCPRREGSTGSTVDDKHAALHGCLTGTAPAPTRLIGKHSFPHHHRKHAATGEPLHVCVYPADYRTCSASRRCPYLLCGRKADVPWCRRSSFRKRRFSSGS